MDLWIVVYLIGFIDALALFCFLFILALWFLALCYVASIYSYNMKEEIKTERREHALRMIKMSIPAALLCVFLPTKTTAYTMLAAYGVQGISETEEAKRIGSKSFQLIEETLDKYLEETKETKNE